MGNIVVVTDSTANLPPELATAYNLPIIPLNVHWDGETYLDGVTLDSATFYRRLQERKSFPTTSQPSAGAFIEFFREAAARFGADTVVGVFISSELSGTYASAMQAKQELSDLHVEVVDSRMVSIALGFQVLAAARAVRAGGNLQEVLEAIHHVRARTSLFFTVDTLEFLYRGGRIGGAARLFGTALNLKPLLAVVNGRVDALEKIRGRRKSLQRLLDLMEEQLDGRPLGEVALIDIDAHEDTELVATQLVQRFQPRQLYRALVAPVVGAHAGPGTVGVAFYPEDTI